LRWVGSIDGICRFNFANKKALRRALFCWLF
jgi:hypothetical protein